MDKVSGGSGYARREVAWATAEAPWSIVDTFERAEAEMLRESLRKFASLFEDDDED